MPRRAKDEDLRTEFLHVRLTPAERVRIAHRAAVAGVTVSAWALHRLLSGPDNESEKSVPPPPVLQPAMVAELKRMGNNFNQIARGLNARREISARDVVQQVYDFVQALIRDDAIAARVAYMRSTRPGAPVLPTPQSKTAERRLGAVRSRHGLDADAGVDRGGPHNGSPHP